MNAPQVQFHKLQARIDELEAAAHEHRALEQALRTANQTLVDERSIFLTGNVVVFKWQNQPGWPVEYVSPNVMQVFGHSDQAFVTGQVSYASLVHPDDLERVAAEVQQASLAGVTSFDHQAYRIVHRSGREVWLHDHTSLLRDAGDIVSHFIGYVIDITARKEAEREQQQLERQVLHAQKLESLGLIAGGIAHDFNNLLTAILGNAELCRLDIPDGLESGYLDEIVNASQQGAGLCRQLLAYSGRARFHIEPVDLGQLVQEMVQILAVSMSKRAQLHCRFEPDLPVIEADASQLRQVVMNLITNASEALGDKDGYIAVDVRVLDAERSQLDAFPSGCTLPERRYVRLEVADTGCGMSAAVRERLFEPFYSTKFAGRGLGLAAVLGIVRGHRGAVRVESTPGQGTCVVLLFPSSEVPTVASRSEEVCRPLQGAGSILVVDDDPPVRNVCGALIATLGFKPLFAVNGKEALEVFHGNRESIVCVVLDLAMPVMDGEQTLRALRALDRALPVVVTSGFTFEQSDALTRLGVDGILPKPYSLADLSKTLAATLVRH